jgi:hypothetical protein
MPSKKNPNNPQWLTQDVAEILRRVKAIAGELEEAEDWERSEAKKLEDIQTRLIAVEQKLERILSVLGEGGKMVLNWGQPSEAGSGQSKLSRFELSKGETQMPGQETDTQTIPCSEIETDADGNPVTLDPTAVQWAIDDPTIATLVQNADGSATFQAVKAVPPAVNPRTANVSCTDTKTGVVGTDTLTVTDSPTRPGKMVLTFGTPA